MKQLTWTVILLLALLLGAPGLTQRVLAQPGKEPGDIQSGYTQVPSGIEDRDIPGEGRHLGWRRGRHLGWDKERMRQLKEEDPEKFKELAAKRRSQIKARIDQLKEQDPQRYQRLRRQIIQRRRRHLRQLSEKDPEQFRRLLKARRARCQEHLQRLKKRNPKKYGWLNRRMHQMRKLHHLRKEDPEKAEQFLEQHPQLKERYEKMQQRREQRREKGPGQYHGEDKWKGDQGRWDKQRRVPDVRKQSTRPLRRGGYARPRGFGKGR